MLRVGLTGGLGSGKSTVGAMLARLGAHVISADEIGRELMQPGQAVYRAIAEQFGPGVVRPDGSLDRAELARLAFGEGRVEELNAIVHPGVIARQAELTAEIGAREPGAVVVVESALIFETRYSGETQHGGNDGWRSRFDRLVLVTAPEDLKARRFVERAGGPGVLSDAKRTELTAEARRRLAAQLPDQEKAPFCDYVLRNAGTLDELGTQVSALWSVLQGDERAQGSHGGAS